MDASVAAPVLRLASQVIDHRRHNRSHPLPEIIVMALVAILFGADGCDDVDLRRSCATNCARNSPMHVT